MRLPACLAANPPTCAAGQADTTPLPRVVDWAAAADRCQLSELRLRCLSGLARRLACGSSSLTSTFAEAALVAQCCSKSTLTELLALAMAAGQAASPE